MLVLTRRRGERILVGDIEIEVIEARGGKVHIGIVAPLDRPIVREELVRTPDEMRAVRTREGAQNE